MGILQIQTPTLAQWNIEAGPRIWTVEYLRILLAGLCPKNWLLESRFLPVQDKVSRTVARYHVQLLSYNGSCNGDSLLTLLKECCWIHQIATKRANYDGLIVMKLESSEAMSCTSPNSQRVVLSMRFPTFSFWESGAAQRSAVLRRESGEARI